MFASSVTFFPAVDNLGSGATPSAEEYGIEGATLLSSMTQGFRGHDELYSIWSRMKKLTISDPPANRQDKEVASGTEQERIPRVQQKVSCALDEVLTYPNPPADKRRKESQTLGLRTCDMLSPLSSR